MVSMTHDLQTFVRGLRGRFAAADGRNSVSDAELLRRFRESADEAAFELLVWRHGSLVLGTCRRILGPSADVEDAFQATFLALVRQSKRIRNGEFLAGWLHRVARRIAQHARSARLERLRREQRAARFETIFNTSNVTSDLRPLLDEEIDRLPTLFRLAFTLCYLEGKTHEEAARQLGVPVGTLRSRLARAREKLRFRLTHRGVTIGAIGVSIGLIRAELSAAMVNCVMTTIASSHTAAASAALKLMEGALHMTLLKKVKVAATIVIALTVAGGSSAWACHGLRRRRRCPPPVCVCPELPPLAVASAPPVVTAEPPKVEDKPIPPTVTKEPEPVIEPRLKQILTEFAQRNRKRRSLIAQNVTRTEKTAAETRVYTGEFRFLKPDHAALRMVRTDKPNEYELFVWADKSLYEFRPRTKTAVVHSDFGQIDYFVPFIFGRKLPVLGPLSYLLGLDLPELVRRVDVRLAKDVSKRNPHYIYIDMLPRRHEDKNEFTRAQVAIHANSMLPRRVWFEHPNGDQITWDFPSMDETTELKPTDFTPPEPPAGWKTVKN